MKKLTLVLGICTLLICSTLTTMVGTSESTPIVRLPTQDVTMRAENGSTSWFVMTFFNIPAGYDVINKIYPGWCVQLHAEMRRGVNHTVKLFSSYDPNNIPHEYQSTNWDKVNYVINNKQGANKSTLQEVIWWYINDDPVPINNTVAHNIINDTDLHGDNFVPSPGQNVAILNDIVISEFNIQRTFFEFTLPNQVPIGDLVWKDNNHNGIQDTGEPGFPGITVDLYTPNGTEPVDSVTTDPHGYYSFGLFTNGSYYIKFILPSGYQFSPVNQGTDYTKDSDANSSTGKTIISPFDPNEYNTSWDAGMYPKDTQPPTPPVNYAPTADGTAGEPYTAQIGQELRFNGSRSYDTDGTIVSWLWSFGDGTTANGNIVTHAYTTTGTYQVYLTVTDNDGATDMFQTVAHINEQQNQSNQSPLKPTLTGPVEGRRNISYVFNVETTDPEGDNVQYVILWGDNSQNTSLFSNSGQNVQLNHQWATWGFYTVQVYAQDTSNQTSEVNHTVIAIDVRYVGNLGYLINTDSTDPYDAFYSNSTGKQTSTQRQQNGIYLIDTKGDGSFDYQYDPSLNEIKGYGETPGLEYTMLIVGVIIVILLLLLIWFFARRKKNKT